jgi:hypothetical protein
MISVRSITPEDLPIVQAWASTRGCAIEPLFLSPHGFMAESDGAPIMAVWGYMLLDVPIIQLDNLIAEPGSTIQLLRKAWQRLEAVITDWVRGLNKLGGVRYHFVRAFLDPKVARETGWEVNETNLSCVRHVVL